MNAFRRTTTTILFSTIVLLFLTATTALAANVTLSWDANSPTPEGYRVFVRESGHAYNYTTPIWEDVQTTCTLIGLTEGVTYHFVVRAFDGTLESVDSAEVTYTPQAIVPNQGPVASAGQNLSVYESDAVTLDGSASSDPDGTIAGYQWMQTGGPAVSLTQATSAQASFHAPVVAMGGETLTFSLTVTDNEGASDAASVTVSVLKSSNTDVDGDNVPDVLDRFPNDPSEWVDNDNDGIGDNQDPDDDNDGMTDVWETAHQLDPMTNDAALDADGDGISNLDEFTNGTDPKAAPSNTAPDAPLIVDVNQTPTASLTPVLVTSAYFDAENDAHTQSRWQISTEANFASLILDETSTTQLMSYTVGEMVLDTDTTYYWRVQFIDERNAASDWSTASSFTTMAAENSDDANLNGIPDSQEVATSVDLNENGLDDSAENGGIMVANSVEGDTVVGVEPVSGDVVLTSIKSISTDNLPDKSVKMGFGLVGFKLYLNPGVTTASVKLHFDKRVPKGAKLYKYLTDSGWQVYDNAVFATNRKSVTIMLVDGGMGDEDGVQNGVIVDPAGVAYTDESASASTTVSASGSGGGGCFISSATSHNRNTPSSVTIAALLTIMIALGAGLCLAKVRCREK